MLSSKCIITAKSLWVNIVSIFVAVLHCEDDISVCGQLGVDSAISESESELFSFSVSLILTRHCCPLCHIENKCFDFSSE